MIADAILMYSVLCTTFCHSWTFVKQGDVRDIPSGSEDYSDQDFGNDVFGHPMYEDDVSTEQSSYSYMEGSHQTSTDDAPGDDDWEFSGRETIPEDEVVDYVHADIGDPVFNTGQELRVPDADDSGRLEANVEVLAVVDYCIYRKYLRQHRHNKRKAHQQIEQYYKMLFSMVDQRFSTINSPSLSVRVSLAGIVIPQSRKEARWLENSVTWPRSVRQGVVNVDTALWKFQVWLRKQYANLPSYDHAVVFTGHRLYKGRRKIDGLAYIGTICRSLEGKSSSVVYDNGDFLAVGITGHELGHSLGATHDGDLYNPECSANDDNMMAPDQTVKIKRTTSMFYFSRCSIQQMINHLRHPKRKSCLTDGTKALYNTDGRKSPGSMYGLTKQCQLVFGPESDFCQRPGHNENICGQLWCTNPVNKRLCQTKSRLVALPGTVCSPQKICHLGRCLSASNIEESNYIKQTPSIDCPVGDKDIMYCVSVAKTYGRDRICNHALVRPYCCQTCSMRL